MRHLISGLVAAVAVMAAAPAMACGYNGCYAAEAYVAPPVVAYTSSGCNPCGGAGWGYDRLADPVEQYYYVNQGPTYSGPGAWAPAPVYREGTVSGYAPVYGNGYGYGSGYRYGYGVRRGIGYGYGARVGYGARYAHGGRYGYHGGARFGGYRGRAHFGRY
jgi:hypothetical protein